MSFLDSDTLFVANYGRLRVDQVTSTKTWRINKGHRLLWALKFYTWSIGGSAPQFNAIILLEHACEHGLRCASYEPSIRMISRYFYQVIC